MIGIDHIALAVKDLDEAADTYRRLGFVIKPGRFHADGILNKHVKFEGGAGIELITAPAATDALTTQYVQLLRDGEGPAFVGFHAANLKALTDRLGYLGQGYSVHKNLVDFTSPTLHWFFMFGGSNRSTTDRAEYFAHPNTTNATIAVWIAGGDQPSMLGLFTALGARVGQKRVHVPDEMLASVATLADGEIIFLPSSRQIIPGRPIVGVVVRTRDLSALRHVLQPAVERRSVRVETTTYRSVFVRPQDAHGTWLEFRELH